jgi:hypothetical protein
MASGAVGATLAAPFDVPFEPVLPAGALRLPEPFDGCELLDRLPPPVQAAASSDVTRRSVAIRRLST